MDEQNLRNFGPFRLDVRNEQLWREHEVLHLTNKALAVLRYLVEHQGQLVTKDDLFAAVWPGVIVSDSALVVCIRELRQTLGDERRTPQFIETVHGRGYRFVAPLITTQPVASSQQSVASDQEVVSSQQPVVSSQEEEESHKVNGREIETEIEKTPLPDGGLLSQDSELRTQGLPSAAPARSWSSKGLVLVAVLLLTGIALTVHYLSRPTLSTQDSALRTEAAPAALPLPDKPSIAVLPFTNMSEDLTQEYFSDGLTDDLITDLSQISSLFVIARYSSFTYKGKPTKVQEIGRELGVRYVLEGSVQKGEGRVRINAQLVDAATGYHLWSERYDRLLTEIFAVQDEIRQQIVANLRVEVFEAEIARVRRIPTVDLTAYDLYLRGREASGHALFGTKAEANIQARQLFEKAIKLDPHYAGAYAELGFTYWLGHFYGWDKDRVPSLEQALALAQKAVVLDDSLPSPHRILGQIYFWKKQFEQAISEMERAIALDPNGADGYERLGNVLGTGGQPKEAIGFIEKAMRLNPRYPSYYLVNLGIAYLADGRCEEALTPLKKVLTMTPNFTPAYTNLAACYAELGRLDEAKAAAETVMRLNPQFSLDVVRQRAPIKDPALLEWQITALRKAGLK